MLPGRFLLLTIRNPTFYGKYNSLLQSDDQKSGVYLRMDTSWRKHNGSEKRTRICSLSTYVQRETNSVDKIDQAIVWQMGTNKKLSKNIKLKKPIIK